MNASDALAYIAARLHPEDDPEISLSEMADLLFMAATDDEDGNSPDDDAWTPTYSTVGCYRAIAEGWTIKAGKAVGRFDFTTDGQQFRRSQTLDHCEYQRRMWARKVQHSSSTLGAAS